MWVKKESIVRLNDDIIFDPKISSFFFGNYSSYDENIVDSIKSKFIKNQREVFYKRRRITNINLFPTYVCHGSCPYCYSKDSINKESTFMTVEDLKVSLEKIKSSGMDIDPYTVRVYGGEPLLADNLYDLIKYLKKEYNSIDTVYISSGLLFSDDVYEKAKDTLKNISNLNVKMSVGVSVDFGTTPFTRTCSNYSVDQRVLLDRIDDLVENNINCVVATVVSKNTDIDNCITELSNHHRKHQYLLENMSIETDSVRPLAYRVSVACDDTYHPSALQLNSLYKQLLKMYKNNDIVTSNIFPYTDVIASAHLYKIDDNTFTLLYPPTYCGIYTYMMEVFPRGEIGSCHMEMFDRSVSIDEHSLNKRMLLEPRNCYDCDFFLVCRGACINRLKFSEESNNSYCTWIKYSFDLALERLYSIYKDDFKKFLNANTNKELLI